MSSGDTVKKAEMPETCKEDDVRKTFDRDAGVSSALVAKDLHPPKHSDLMIAVIERENMLKATRQVISNRGAAGIDRMSTEAIANYLRTEWPRIRRELTEERYQPKPALRVEIPKTNGGVRKLGIPTVLDRIIQQAIHQVLSPIFEPTFSDSSYGFRPGRSAHQAVRAVKEFASEGRTWVVDMDLEKFFDQVNHDILMSRLARRIEDKPLLRLIRKYLRAGVVVDGKLEPTEMGTPQGGPLSPLLSNILLTDLDRELERRNHKFARYADDCNIYVRSKAAGERVLKSMTTLLENTLKLKVNSMKSAVDKPWRRKFLGFSMFWRKGPNLRVSKEALKTFRAKTKHLFRQGRGRNIERFIKENLNPYLLGWMNYFSLADGKGIFEMLDGWIRRKLRCIIWRQWKTPGTRLRKLKALGIEDAKARLGCYNNRSSWFNSRQSHLNEAIQNSYFTKLGLVSLKVRHQRAHSV
jgi:RNA-directed DNA polymerase